MMVAFTEIVARLLEFLAVVLIAIGAAEAVYAFFYNFILKRTTRGFRHQIWLDFAQWILLGLEFTMAADIVKTALAPTWDSIGQLAAIAVTRTFLSFFLERDLEMANESTRGSEH
jgi:uncharacterized membrane protein